MGLTLSSAGVKVADEVFIATVLLHRENPGNADFSVGEIVGRARREGLNQPLRPGVQVHASLHCVANRAANPGTYRMLFETGQSRRRLLQRGDSVHPSRTGKLFPEPGNVPARYYELIEWAKSRYTDGDGQPAGSGPDRPTGLKRLLALRGMGAKFWKAGEADAYVESLRKDGE